VELTLIRHRLEVLANLHAKGDRNDPVVLAEFQEIKDAIQFEREQAVSSVKALFTPPVRKRVVLGMSIQMWSQLCGMNIMMYVYIPVCQHPNKSRYYIVFIMKGAAIADELLTASVQYVINVVMTLPAIIYLDRFGRRPALLLGSFGMMTLLFLSGGLQGGFGRAPNDSDPKGTADDISWTLGKDNPGVSKFVVACSYLFVATFATTWGPVSWT
jgi:Sugar (and other) transporter